jgi:hypothetical protein
MSETINVGSKKYIDLLNKINSIVNIKQHIFHVTENEYYKITDFKELEEKIHESLKIFEMDYNQVYNLIILVLKVYAQIYMQEIDSYETFLTDLEVLKDGWKDIEIIPAIRQNADALLTQIKGIE